MKNNIEEILDKTNRGLDVFEYYIPELKTNGTKKNFRAVFRDDGNNSDANVFFSEKTKRWMYHDFVSGESLDPFDFVMKLNSCSFADSAEIIARDVLHNLPVKREHVKADNSFSIEAGGSYDYWFRFGNREAILKTAADYGLSSLKSYSFIKEKNKIETKASENDPVFAFRISDNCYKIYRPFSPASNFKHIWLGKKPSGYNDVFGIHQLPENIDYVLIVEGLKDAITANANGIPAIGIDNAGTRINKKILDMLFKKTRHVLLCLDSDEAGINASEKLSKENGIHILNLPKEILGEKGKDISDYFESGNSAKELNDLILERIKNIEENNKSNENAVPELKGSRISAFEKTEQIISKVFTIRYNEVSNDIEYRRKEQDEAFSILNENNVFRFLQHNHVEFSMAKLTAMLKSDFVPRYNPFASYFENLKIWNAEKDTDYISLICDYIPVTDTERFRNHFKKALVRSVACSIDSTVINKQALILVHDEQNSGKTTFIRWLCPPELQKYIAENISTDKDSLIALCENFIINLDELATLSRAEINSLKSMFSKETVKIRRPYDKGPTTSPRRASFFGSTNKAEFLTDETGSVRWLCFELKEKINWDYKKDIDINDIWRQAFTLYKSGFRYELTAEEIRENESVNQQYQITTPEIELIQKYYTPGTKDEHEKFYQATDFVIFLSEKCPGIKINQNNVGKALKILGYERSTKRNDKYPVKGYYVNLSNNF